MGIYEPRIGQQPSHLTNEGNFQHSYSLSLSSFSVLSSTCHSLYFTLLYPAHFRSIPLFEYKVKVIICYGSPMPY